MILGAIGLALAVAPIVGAQLAIEHSTRKHAETVTDAVAEEFVANAARVIGSGLNAINLLSLEGVSACDGRALARMRTVTTSVLPVKVAAVVDADGSIRCNQFGSADTIEALSPRQAIAGGNASLRLVRLRSTGSKALMVERALDGGGGLAAFISDEAIDANMLPPVFKDSLVGTLRLIDGAAITHFQPSDVTSRDAAANDPISAEAHSLRFPIAMNLTIPFRVFENRSSELLAYARIGGGIASTLIFALLVYLLRGPPVEIARLREAHARGEFVPYYQPLIDIGSGRLVGCEVLMRWVKPNGTVIEPDSFILLAESSGLAVSMTRSLMRAVRDDLDHAFGARPRLKININLFNDHFVRLKTVRDIVGIFGGASVSFSQLVFELTERLPLRDVRRARVVIRELQALGARVALDDAGAGHGGLAYLHHLGVDMVKIDRLFIETIGVGKTAAPIVNSLIKLGHDLGMEVVAEGVETFEQLDYLRRHGADSAQGFLFSPPLPARAFLDLVETMEPVGRDLAAGPAPLPASRRDQPAAVPAA